MTNLERGPSSDGESAICASSLNKPSSQEGLKPCPFCGNAPLSISNYTDRKPTWAIFCHAGEKCPVTVTVCERTEAEATVAWNTRHPSFNDAIEAAAKIVDEPLNGIEINRFIADGKVMTDRYGRELFITKENVEHILAAISSAIRSLKLPDYRGGEAG